MKLTEYQLFQAIGQADEKMLRDAAPAEWEAASGDRRFPLLLKRRTAELIAVCAAVCIFVGGGFLIRKLYTAQKQEPDPVYATDEEAARAALEQFFYACKTGNKEQMLKYSLIEEVNQALASDGTTNACDETKSYLKELCRIRDYEIGEGTDVTAELKEAEQNEADQIELLIYELEAIGEHEEAEKLRGPNPYLELYSHEDMAYAFYVRLTVTGEPWSDYDENGNPNDGAQFPVCRYDGVWRVDPGYLLRPEGMTEKGRIMLEKFRSGEDFDAKAFSREYDAREALTAYLDICSTGDTERIMRETQWTPYLESSQSRPAAGVDTIIHALTEQFAGTDSYEITELIPADDALAEMTATAERRTLYQAWLLHSRGKTDEEEMTLYFAPEYVYYQSVDHMFRCTVRSRVSANLPEREFFLFRNNNEWEISPAYESEAAPDELGGDRQQDFDAYIASHEVEKQPMYPGDPEEAN